MSLPAQRALFWSGGFVLAIAGVAAAQPSARSVPIAYAASRTAAARAEHEGELVTVVGTASVDSTALSSGVFRLFIQDDQSGIALFSRHRFALIRVGDVVRASGRIASYRGSVEIVVDAVETVSHSAAPTPEFVPAPDLVGGSHCGRLVRTYGQVLDVAPNGRGIELRIPAGTEPLVVRLGEAQKQTFPIPGVGETINVTGISTAFQAAEAAPIRWQILPRTPPDVEVVAKAAPFTGADVIKASALGAAAVAIVLLWNISLRRRVRREMREHDESETRFSAVAETAPVAIFIYQDSVFRYVNRAAKEVTGYEPDELVGREFWAIVHPEDRDLVRDRGRARLRGDTVPARYEFRIVRKDGRSAWLEFGAASVRYGGGTAALGTAFDITARKRSEEVLLESEQRFRALVENSSDGIVLLDRDGRISWAGPSTQRVLGFTERELVGMDAVALVHPDDQVALRHVFGELVAAAPGRSATIEYQGRGKESGWRTFEMTFTNLLTEAPVKAVVGNYRDVTERRQVEEEMRHQALHDTLTGLPNRSLYHDRLGLAIAHAQRTGRPLAVMFVDLDLFKQVNDNLGHTIGDRLLRIVGGRLRDCVRASDTVARVGGDEFTVVIEDLDEVERARQIADALLERIALPCTIDGHELLVSASIGMSIFPADGDDPDTLTRNADKAMYRAKELGRHNAQVFTAEMDERYRARHAFEVGFRGALERGEFVLYYQPIYAADGGPVGVEALVRWNDPARGVISPDDFIGAAEETHLIVPLGEWVLRTACAQAARWSREGHGSLKMSVNISVRQFHQRVLLRAVDEALRDTGLDPHLLELEITESVAMQNVDQTRTLLQQLRARGISIAIDDFGAGYSSLIYLRQFPIDTIKIDRAFIRQVPAEDGDGAIVTAMIRLAHELGLRVTAEGVEREEQRRFLVGKGCDLLQGYLFGEPLPADAMGQALPPTVMPAVENDPSSGVTDRRHPAASTA